MFFTPCGTWPGGDVLPRGFDVGVRIVEEDVGAERLQERTLVAAAEEQRLVEANAPAAQREDHALVRGRGARGDQRGADRRCVARRKRLLQAMQRGEEALERPAGQRLVDELDFVAMERLDALFVRDAFGFVAEDHRVAVEGDAQLIARAIARLSTAESSPPRCLP